MEKSKAIPAVENGISKVIHILPVSKELLNDPQALRIYLDKMTKDLEVGR